MDEAKKAKTEKLALLQEYFILKNSLRVKQFFAEEELLIGKDYWNFVCVDAKGFEIVFTQYKKSAGYIKEVLERIKAMYFR